MYVPVESSAHTNRLRATVTATMQRKRTRQTGNRSWGRKPTVYANDDNPDVAFCGSVNNVFDMLGSMNSGEFRSFSCSAKSEGG